MPNTRLFSREAEFPNYLGLAFNELVTTNPDETVAFEQLQTYLSSYLENIISQLHVPHTVAPGITAQTALFPALLQSIHDQLTSEQNQKYTIEISIDGRTVQTLLAKIYQDMYAQRSPDDTALATLDKARAASGQLDRLNTLEVLGLDHALTLCFDVKKQDGSELTESEAAEVSAINQAIKTHRPDVIQ
ncbi:MAG: hypothetical protein K0U24_07430 [Gammaproteobacteria bacterium]|nr:hypothetical protein [Gammaproteobacteria bacterium]MCH9764033.1 hypothetical protein [Gammaproteobacteria bacterium]